MARSSSTLLAVLVIAAVCSLTTLFVGGAGNGQMRGSKLAQQASPEDVMRKGGMGSVLGGLGSSSFSAPSSPAPSAPSSSPSAGAGGQIADGNYVVGITLFFFVSVYANSQLDFFGPW
eukprot:TRINITY_DN105419_c0_g1_i1.p1 TRINITY_DN105419_c0_g1~~TRINITY_DN105419_c0_g1_i1.p1  ORF type:complete len:118 (+),score=30.17 TRINITY_DN105419_c0_g1_i1:61-414(+)